MPSQNIGFTVLSESGEYVSGDHLTADFEVLQRLYHKDKRQLLMWIEGRDEFFRNNEGVFCTETCANLYKYRKDYMSKVEKLY